LQDRRIKLSDPEQAEQLAQRLKAQGNLSALTPDHWLIIRDYLLDRQDLLVSAKSQTSQRLADQVKIVIQLPETVNPSPEILLEAVYLACQDSFPRRWPDQQNRGND
jgi:hypothetical protein